MENIKIPYKETGYFSKIILDYLDEKQTIQPFYNRFPKLENFEAQIKEKEKSFSLESRKILVSALESQYRKIETSQLTREHIEKLSLPTTFTVTTGHQLNLFSGPLYFLYKIISTINLCKELKQKYPKHNFTPIYWMASEDHDFEEIQYFNFKNKKISWNKSSGGAVGRLSTEGLDAVFMEFSKLLNTGKNAEELRLLFDQSYLKHSNLTEASRYLVNALFGEYGLVIVDGDDKALKQLFKPYALKELKDQITFENVTKTNQKLEIEGYKIQVNPREINLFYNGDGFRERVVKEAGVYKVHNTNIEFLSAEELFSQTDKLEFVSGNALLRPLYQEVILPNLSYIGGGGELAYWMQLKSTFQAFQVPFPILLLRNSALLISKKQQNKIDKLGIELKDLFLTQHKLTQKIVEQRSKVNFDFELKRNQLQETFRELSFLSYQTDPSFIGAVKAQEKKQLKGLKHLEKRLLKAEKRKMYELVVSIENLQNELFPNYSLEERSKNFSEYYESYGKELIAALFKELQPLNLNFSVVHLNS